MDTSEQVAIETAKRVKRWRRSVEEKRRIVEETSLLMIVNPREESFHTGVPIKSAVMVARATAS